jgi:hypothetical protein
MEKENIEINPSNDNFKGISHSHTSEFDNKNNEIKKENSSNKLKGLFNKVKTMKNIIPSFKKENQNENKNNSNEQQEIKISSSNEISEKTYKDKIKDYLIDKIEIEKSIIIFLALFGTGILLLFLSLIFLPVIIVSPAKFSLCFALGSLLFLTSFLFWYGTKKYFEKIFSKERFWISIFFIVSIFIGCGFALGKHYLISLICSIFQLVSLVLFILTFLPGGKLGINCIKNIIKSTLSRIWTRMVENEINQ